MPDKPQGRRSALLLALAIFLFYVFATTRSTLWDRDEPRFAQASVEMVASGNYLYPTFNHDLRPDKPILIYWLQALPVRIFGASEWTVRFWGPVGAALAALFTAFIGRRLFGARTGLFAAAMLATTPLVFIEGTAATVDAVLLACTTAAVALFVRSLFDGVRVLDLVGLAIALFLAQLTKGPVGLLMPLLAIVATLVALRRRAPDLAPPRSYAGGIGLAVLASIGLFAVWFLPANAATGGEFLRRAFVHHVVDRVASPADFHGPSYLAGLPIYLPVVLVLFAPWTTYLPAGFSALLGGRIGDPRARALLVSWIATCFLFMTFVATRRAQYVLSMWPALALLAGATIDAATEGRLTPRDRRWLARGAILQAIVNTVLVAGFVAMPLWMKMRELRLPLWTMAAILGIHAAWGLWLHTRDKHLEGALALFGGTCGAYVCLTVVALPAFEKQKPIPALASAVRTMTAPAVPVARFGFDGASFDFYLDRPPIEYLGNEERLEAWTRKPGPGVLVIPRTGIEANPTVLPGRLVELAAFSGFNYEKGKPFELVALARGNVASR